MLLYPERSKVIDEDILPKKYHKSATQDIFLMSVGFNQLNSVAEISHLKIQKQTILFLQ